LRTATTGQASLGRFPFSYGRMAPEQRGYQPTAPFPRESDHLPLLGFGRFAQGSRLQTFRGMHARKDVRWGSRGLPRKPNQGAARGLPPSRHLQHLASERRRRGSRPGVTL